MARIVDARANKVVFLSHCLLDVNARYPGGAGRPAAVSELIAACMECDLGIVQMPCPEQRAWGGAGKPRLRALLGAGRRHPILQRLWRPLAAIGWGWTRGAYRRLARSIAAQIEDCIASGIAVTAVIGVDGSPSCGVAVTLDRRATAEWLALDAERVTARELNAALRRCATPGQGVFVEELQRQLSRRGLRLPLLSHDLFAEQAGRPSMAAGALPVLTASPSG